MSCYFEFVSAFISGVYNFYNIQKIITKGYMEWYLHVGIYMSFMQEGISLLFYLILLI